MYDEQVMRLRDAAQWADKGFVITPSICLIAANAIEELTGFVQEAERDRDEYRERLDKANDTIEELAAFKAQITDGRFYVYKLGTLFELKHDPRELVVRYQDPTEPPKEET